ncbi:hypothetical protein WG908_03215 [Sphingobium sp. AN641]|uniref:hypothetical protein n=1 Tax=Sphingobium sp. AN641 TaxID=3133443 RepID=UPI0030C5B696
MKRDITGVPRPEDRYSPSRAPAYGRYKSKFPSFRKAQGEARKRARLTRNVVHKGTDAFDDQKALALAERLLASANGDETDSLACPIYMGRQRFNIGGAFWKLGETGDPKTFTVIPRDWIYTPDELAKLDPKLLIRRFLAQLERKGIRGKTGYLFAGLHGEYDLNTGLFHVHLHGFVDGEMVDVVRSLKKLPRYRFNRRRDIRSPIRIRWKSLTNLPHPLIYTIQDWWPARYTFIRDGKPVRGRKRRIPEPYHTLLLLWLDQWSLSDVTLMVGMSVGKDGLVVKRV